MNRSEALAGLTAVGQTYELNTLQALGRSVRAFRNGPGSLLQLYADTRSLETFLVYQDERLSFEDVWRRSCTLARYLVDVLGVKKADRVAISMRNYPEWVVAFEAATMIGAVAVALNAQWQPGEMEFALDDARPKVLCADGERLERLAGCTRLPADLEVIGVRELPAGFAGHRMADILSERLVEEPPPVSLHPDDDAIMLYTSGSTGHPKGAVSTHRNIISALMSWELDAQASLLIGGAAPTAATSQPAALLTIPLFHVSGLHVCLLSSYRAQRRLVCMFKWDAYLAAELIECERIDNLSAPAAVTGDLIAVARRTTRDLSSLKAVGGGGAPRAPEQVRAIGQAFANAQPLTGWGMTETNAIGVSIAAADYLRRPESSGRVSAVLDIRIVDEGGLELPCGMSGELQVRGASIMRTYWNRPEANAETFDGEWLRTGDVAYLDEEGFCYIVDRIKDLVIRGGENIGCGSVEAAILEHPDVLEASVYGVPDPRLGEEIGVTLYSTTTVDVDELLSFLRPRLAGFQLPRYVRAVNGPLPRIASGKIDKRQLRQDAIRELASRV